MCSKTQDKERVHNKILSNPWQFLPLLMTQKPKHLLDNIKNLDYGMKFSYSIAEYIKLDMKRNKQIKEELKVEEINRIINKYKDGNNTLA